MNVRIAASLGAALSLGLATIAQATDSCPAPCTSLPANARFVSSDPTPVLLAASGPFAGTVLLTTPGATLKKAKKKRVVAVDATMSSGVGVPNVPMTLHLQAAVDTVPPSGKIYMEPATAGGIIEDCGGIPTMGTFDLPDFACSISGSFCSTSTRTRRSSTNRSW